VPLTEEEDDEKRRKDDDGAGHEAGVLGAVMSRVVPFGWRKGPAFSRSPSAHQGVARSGSLGLT